MTLEAFRKARSEAKRDAILHAASACFRQNGYARASMETVAKLADVSTATLYRHFSSKADLFEAVARSTMDRLYLDVIEREDPSAHLSELARAYARLLSDPDTRGMVRAVIAECGRDQALAERFYTAVKSRLSDMFVVAIQRGEEAGVLKRVDRPDQIGGQLQGMIEHATLLRGLVLGDQIETLSEADEIADEAFHTWMAPRRSIVSIQTLQQS